MKILKKVLASLMAVAMMVTFLPTVTFAEENYDIVKINYWDVVAGAQAEEVEVAVAKGTTHLTYESVEGSKPQGYVIDTSDPIVNVDEGYQINGGYAFVPVRKIITVYINYYDFDQGKQIEEVPVNVIEGTDVLTIDTVNGSLPAGYGIDSENLTFQINDRYVQVPVKELKPVEVPVEINYWDEIQDKQIALVEVKVWEGTTDLADTEVNKNLPVGYEIVNPQIKYAILDGYVYVSVKESKPVEVPVKINYYDETEEKQVAEVEVKVWEGTTDLADTEVNKNLPAGYEIVKPEVKYAINGGYVYVSVKELKPVEVPVKINYYDETEEKQVAEVEVKVWEGTTDLADTEVNKNLPAGYEIVKPEVKYVINDGYVYVSVKESKPVEVPVKINYYDETEEKQVAEVEVKVWEGTTDLADTKVNKNLPSGYEIVNPQVKYAINDGYVYVSVKRIELKEISFKFYADKDGISEEVAASFTIGGKHPINNLYDAIEDKHIPSGYKLAGWKVNGKYLPLGMEVSMTNETVLSLVGDNFDKDGKAILVAYPVFAKNELNTITIKYLEDTVGVQKEVAAGNEVVEGQEVLVAGSVYAEFEKEGYKLVGWTCGEKYYTVGQPVHFALLAELVGDNFDEDGKAVLSFYPVFEKIQTPQPQPQPGTPSNPQPQPSVTKPVTSYGRPNVNTGVGC